MTKAEAIKNKEGRQSNIELLRIVLMFMIVSLHFLILDVYPQIWDERSLDKGVVTASILNGFLYVAVNCYILVSGYFGVHFRIKSLLKLYSICFVYGLLAYLIHIIVDGDGIGRSLLFNSVFCISCSKLWYVKCYFALIIISPILNRSIDSFTKKQHQLVLIGLTIINVYFGYLWQVDGFDKDGYTLEQFIYLYFIGRYIKKYVSLAWIKTHRLHNFLIYCGSACIWGGGNYTKPYN